MFQKDIKRELNSNPKLSETINYVEKFFNIKTYLREYARIYMMYVPLCIENSKLSEPQIVEITHSIE